ncbi:MAG: hypothetical protein D6768_15195 [Chloroflexi bacterium]|nr:MAG: hypothetical protein D6768_15195 [Chloroflexota bacterium]
MGGIVKKLTVALAAAVVLSLVALLSGALGDSGVQADGNKKSKVGVMTFVEDGLYSEVKKVGKSTLERGNDNIKVKIKTKKLISNGVYTVWWVIFNNPAGCATTPCDLPDIGNPAAEVAIIWADAGVAEDNGKIEFEGELKTGQAGIDELPAGALHNGMLTNPMGAQVENHIVFHGDAANATPQWFLDDSTGDPNVCNVNIGTPDDPVIVCPLAQLARQVP